MKLISSKLNSCENFELNIIGKILGIIHILLFNHYLSN